MRSKSKVEEWMNKSGDVTADEDEEDSDDAEGSEGSEEGDGEGGDLDMEVVESRVFGGKTGERINYLNNELKVTTTFAKSPEALEITKLLLSGLSRLPDDKTHDALVRILVKLAEKDAEEVEAEAEVEGTTGKDRIWRVIVKFAHDELERASSPSRTVATHTFYPLMTLVHVSYTTLSKSRPSTFSSNPIFKPLVISLAYALDGILTPREGKTRMKGAMQKGAIARTRRVLRSNYRLIPQTFEALYDSLPKNGDRLVPLLGVLTGVSIRLKVLPKQKDEDQELLKDKHARMLRGKMTEVFVERVLGSKVPLPKRVYAAFDDLWTVLADPKVFVETIMPAVDKLLIRSPETSLPIITHICEISSIDMSEQVPQKLVPGLISATKSTKPENRSAAVAFGTALAQRLDESAQGRLMAETMASPTSGKTTGPDNRIALFNIAETIPANASTSGVAVAALAPLLSKETNEPAIEALCSALTRHLSLCTVQDIKQPDDKCLASMKKDVTSVKTALRRQILLAIADALWASDESETWSPAGVKLAEAILPGLESAFKSATTILPAGAVSALLEPYMAVALVGGPLARHLGSNPKVTALQSSVAGLMQLKPKPSFLTNDKVWRKVLVDETDPKLNARIKTWMLRAFEVAVNRNADQKVEKAIRIAVTNPLVVTALEGADYTTRQQALTSVQKVTERHPKSFGDTLLASIDQWLDQSASETRIDGDNEAHTLRSLQTRAVTQMIAKLINVRTTATPTQVEGRKAGDALLIASLLLLHHPYFGPAASQIWLDNAVTTGSDPAILAQSEMEQIMTMIRQTLQSPFINRARKQAALQALTTITYIAPHHYVPAIVQEVTAAMDTVKLDFIGPFEIGVWGTPAGELFEDVLSQKKEAVLNKNSKTYAQDKWDQEVRESIAKKKAGSTGGTLSKQDQALVHTQTEKENAVRAKMLELQSQFSQGLDTFRALLNGRTEVFDNHLEQILGIVIASAVGPAAFLVGEAACALYLDLSKVCQDIDANTARFTGVTLLRAQASQGLSENVTSESVSEQCVRVLHSLHTSSQKGRYEAVTLVYVLPLLSLVIENSGLGEGAEKRESAPEQLTLVVEILANIVAGMNSLTYPRLAVARDLISLSEKQPSQAKAGMAALARLGETIQDNATPGEVQALIEGILSKESYVRNGSLQALQPLDLTELVFPVEIFIGRFDNDEPNVLLADSLWEENGLDVTKDYLGKLLPFLQHDVTVVRNGAAQAIAEATAQFPEQVKAVLEGLRSLYVEKARVLAPEFDKFGMVIPESLDRQDPSHIRVAVARALQAFSPLMNKAHILALFDFLVIEEALGDRASEVRQALLAAGVTVVDAHGDQVVSELIARFEAYLAQPTNANVEADFVKEGVVVLFGRLAKHLPPGDKRTPIIIDRLLIALETPSEIVQVAVADCLPPLVKVAADQTESFLDRLFETLTTGAKYAARRGAAYGLAGLVKGRGLSVLSENELLSRLQESMQDKKNYQARQGAVFAYETLTSTLGRTFEPYLISIIPSLLTLFGDAQADVREATSDAAKVIMSKISGHCVKQILPLLLEGLEEKQWRTKKGSIELLGAMAFCAPKQLSYSLPTIIPQLTGVLTDSHAQVRAAANTSLKTFGEVLSNPEIKKLQPTLLKALADPTSRTATALTALLATSFEHYLDSPSLALVVPILDRGLKERSSETKRKSVLIVGNMASLTESRDFIPYLGQLLPLIQAVLVDPVPEARATAAKALGTLVERLGEENFPSLVTKLLQTLRSDTSGVDRQGAAQGLSEVLAGLGVGRMEGLLPDIINSASSPRSYVREGFISLLIYLPATFGQRFAPHLGRIIPPILGGLADESEYVRDASMRAGKMIISNYANRAIELLLPELERGMLDPVWRIRQSSIALTGELLYKVTGISGKVEIEEDEAPAQHSDAARKALVEALGQDGRDRVLAILYIVRQDDVGMVRQASIHIWKALVHNTPKTAREILPTLFKMMVDLMGSEVAAQRDVASRTLTELCRKSGDRVIGEIIPMMRSAVTSPMPRTREGACMALAELIDNTSSDNLETHEDTVIDAVRSALIDEDAAVRVAAAKAFDALQEAIGPKTIDRTIPTLLEAMRTPGEKSETALMALKEVMSVRASTVFPTLLPTLTAQPITAFNARALAALVTVAGEALSKRLSSVLKPLVKSMEAEKDESIREEVQTAIRALLSSIEDEEGMETLQMLLLGWAREGKPSRKAQACHILATLCEVAEVDASEYRIDWVTQLVSLFNDPSEEVVAGAWTGLDALVKSIPKDELEDLVVPLRKTLEGLSAPGQEVAGLCRTKGAQPIVPILLAGLLTGTEQQKEQAAIAIGDLVQRTSDVAIKPYIIQLTGPLIRVISSGTLAAQIKGAILSTLTVLLQSVPQLVRPFHPQLTRTMIKSVTDTSSSSVRSKAAAGLGELMKHQPRVDPLVTELLTSARQVDPDIAPSVVNALAIVTESASQNMGTQVKEGLRDLIEEAEGTTGPYATSIRKLKQALSGENKVVQPESATRPVPATKPVATVTPPAPVVKPQPAAVPAHAAADRANTQKEDETASESDDSVHEVAEGALESINAKPKFISVEEHAALTTTTPASWSDIPPILRFSEQGVKIEFDPAYQGKAEYKGDLWVTEAAIAFMPSGSTSSGFSLAHPKVTLHAVSRNAETGNCLYCQIADPSVEPAEVDSEDEDDEEYEPLREMRVFVKDDASLDRLYNAFTDCANLHPTPSDPTAPSFPTVFGGGSMGGNNLDFGSGGWITAENVHEHDLAAFEDASEDDDEDESGEDEDDDEETADDSD